MKADPWTNLRVNREAIVGPGTIGSDTSWLALESDILYMRVYMHTSIKVTCCLIMLAALVSTPSKAQYVERFSVQVHINFLCRDRSYYPRIYSDLMITSALHGICVSLSLGCQISSCDRFGFFVRTLRTACCKTPRPIPTARKPQVYRTRWHQHPAKWMRPYMQRAWLICMQTPKLGEACATSCCCRF